MFDTNMDHINEFMEMIGLFEKSKEFFEKFSNEMCELDFVSFMSIMCATVDIYCKENGLDAKEVAREMCASILTVNDELGQM